MAMRRPDPDRSVLGELQQALDLIRGIQGKTNGAQIRK
jgi:hypothetical protein